MSCHRGLITMERCSGRAPHSIFREMYHRIMERATHWDYWRDSCGAPPGELPYWHRANGIASRAICCGQPLPRIAPYFTICSRRSRHVDPRALHLLDSRRAWGSQPPLLQSLNCAGTFLAHCAQSCPSTWYATGCRGWGRSLRHLAYS